MTSALRTTATAALGRTRARANIRRAMLGLQHKRRKAFPDADELERLRDQGAAIRDEALARLPELLQELEARCRANGTQVHWAADAADANRLIIELLERQQTDALLKGKSMVSEEIGLNAALEAVGIEPVETDLGELIIQLAGDHPSHIVAPAVHKDRHEVAELFAERLILPVDEAAADAPACSAGHGPSGGRNRGGRDRGGRDRGADSAQAADGAAEAARLAEIERLTAQALALMRRRFKQVRAGLSGVNFAVA